MLLTVTEKSSSHQRINGAVRYTSEGRSTLQIGNESSGPTRKDWKFRSMDEYREVKIDGGSYHPAMAEPSNRTLPVRHHKIEIIVREKIYKMPLRRAN